MFKFSVRSELKGNTNKKISMRSIENMTYHDLIDKSDLQTLKENDSIFRFFHDLRNEVYHNGSLVLAKKDVESALSYTKSLFNELHPNHKLRISKFNLPTSHAIEITKKHSGYTTEFYMMTLFAESFKQKRYLIVVNPMIGSGMQADMIMIKNRELIILEFKSQAAKVTVMGYRKELQEKYDRVRIWIISAGLFSSKLRQSAGRDDVTLIDDTNLHNYVNI